MLGEPIREFSGKIIAWEERKPNGDIVVRNFIGTIIGWYDAGCDVTREFGGKVVAKGDAHGMFIGRN